MSINLPAFAANAVVTGTISTTTLTVTAVSVGSTGPNTAALAVGSQLIGQGITAGTVITALVTGLGGVGTYTISPSQTVSNPTQITAYSPAVSTSLAAPGFIDQIGSNNISELAFRTGGTAMGTLATTAVNGFTWINSGAGTPTGTPANIPTGSVALYYDSTNNKIGVYNGAWKQTAALT